MNLNKQCQEQEYKFMIQKNMPNLAKIKKERLKNDFRIGI
jgi:hypothetical protein